MTYLCCGIEFHVDAQNDSVVSMKPTEKSEENISNSIIVKETKGEENFGTAPVDSISAFSPEMTDNNGNMTSSSKTKGNNFILCFSCLLFNCFY